jgi:hypothetical protein
MQLAALDVGWHEARNFLAGTNVCTPQQLIHPLLSQEEDKYLESYLHGYEHFRGRRENRIATAAAGQTRTPKWLEREQVGAEQLRDRQ